MEADDHCALNVALYGDAGKRWALTERGRSALRRDADSLVIGPSRMTWDGEALEVHIDEWTVPWPRRIRGRVRVEPAAVVADVFRLDADGRHRWWPIAPCGRVEVTLEQPALRWRGAAYLDSNHGDEPLESAFRDWHWSRSPLGDGATAVLYDVTRRDGDRMSLALRIDPSGRVQPIEAPPSAVLPTTGWRIRRATRCEQGSEARVVETLEDTPFYARSLVSSRLHGEPVTGVHESLSLDRFRRGWVQLLLPFRMPRRAG